MSDTDTIIDYLEVAEGKVSTLCTDIALLRKARSAVFRNVGPNDDPTLALRRRKFAETQLTHLEATKQGLLAAIGRCLQPELRSLATELQKFTEQPTATVIDNHDFLGLIAEINIRLLGLLRTHRRARSASRIESDNDSTDRGDHDAALCDYPSPAAKRYEPNHRGSGNLAP